MDNDKIVIRVLLRHYWKKGLSARAASKEICDVEGDGAVSKSMEIEWFKRFNEGNTDVCDKPRSGRPSEVDDEALIQMVLEEPCKSTRAMSADIGCDQSTVVRHLQLVGATKKRFREVPHELTPEQAQSRVDVCSQLLTFPFDERFFKRVVTCDEKWIYMRNPDTRSQWLLPGQTAEPVAKRGRFEPKVLLCVWWNYQGVIHYELIPGGRTINSDLYSEQLQKVCQVVRERYPALVNRRRLLLQHDNARPHTSRTTRRAIQELGCIQVLPHPAYSPDLAPSDYHMFRSMSHFLRGRRFETLDGVENGIKEFFASKSPDWYRSGIEDLARRWMSVIECGGLYFGDKS